MPAAKTYIEKLESGIAPRIVHTYVLPETMRWPGGPTKIGIKRLSTHEELDASGVAGFNLLKSQYEAAKRALCERDDTAISIADGSVDRIWEDGGPKFRAMVVNAYQRMTTPNKGEENSFFASETVSTR